MNILLCTIRHTQQRKIRAMIFGTATWWKPCLEEERGEMKTLGECESLSMAAEVNMKTSFSGFTLLKAGFRKVLGIPKPLTARTTLVFICLEHGREPGPINAGWIDEWCDDWSHCKNGNTVRSGRKSQKYKAPGLGDFWPLAPTWHQFLNLKTSTARWVHGITLSSLAQRRYSVISTECMTTWIKNYILWKTCSSKSLKCHWFWETYRQHFPGDGWKL